MVFYYVFEKTSDSLPMWLVTIMLSVPVGKRSNSRKQKYCNLLSKTPVLGFFWSNFIKKLLQRRCFPMNIAKCLSTVFFFKTLPFYYTFPKFNVMIKFSRSLWVQNWYLSYFLCHYFVFLHSTSVRIESQLLCRIYLVFIPTFVAALARIITTAPSLFWLNH